MKESLLLAEAGYARLHCDLDVFNVSDAGVGSHERAFYVQVRLNIPERRFRVGPQFAGFGELFRAARAPVTGENLVNGLLRHQLASNCLGSA
jgi:hypothetical protein